jgi:hypothetical protein
MVAARRKAVAQTPARADRGVADQEVDPAFHRAILKIAIELRKPSARSYETVVTETIRTMKLDGSAFRRYLGENGARNMSLLLATARAFGL